MGMSSSQPEHCNISFTNTYNVIDFKKTNGYMDYKYHTVGGKFIKVQPTTDDDLPTMIFHQCERSRSPCFIQDKCKIVLQNKKTTINEFPQCISGDGVYDIWLLDCKNVTEITIDIEGVGNVYTKKVEEAMNGNIQIPLYVETSGQGERVDKIMYTQNKNNTYISFIPRCVFIHNEIRFGVNDGAEATLAFSTVYLPMKQRRKIAYNNVYFKINGVQYYYPKSSYGSRHSKPFEVKKLECTK